MKELENNPHVLQMIEILAANPELLSRLENGDSAVIAEVSEMAKEHFFLMMCGIHNGYHKPEMYETIRREMSNRVYYRIRQEAK